MLSGGIAEGSAAALRVCCAYDANGTRREGSSEQDTTADEHHRLSCIVARSSGGADRTYELVVTTFESTRNGSVFAISTS